MSDLATPDPVARALALAQVDDEPDDDKFDRLFLTNLT